MDEKKLETMQGELKLLKCEVKESLVNVRDFLNSLKLPLPFKDLDSGMDNQLSIRGGLSFDSPEPVDRQPSAPAAPAKREPPRPAREPPQSQAKPPPPPPAPRNADEPAETPKAPEKAVPRMHAEKPEDKAQEEEKEDNMSQKVQTGSPQVNLLANLVRWVSVARNEIGNEKLGTFLEIYAIGSDLSTEVKEIILHLAEVVVLPSEQKTTADVWSRLLLELHGILTGGGTALRPLGEPEGEDTEPADVKVEKQPAVKSDRPVRLRLVVPDGKDGEKEFDIEEFSVNLE